MSDIAHIVLEAEGMNALSPQSLAAFRDQLVAAGQRPILLTGAGKAFCAGLNLNAVLTLDEAGMEAFLVLLEEVVERLLHHPAPTVAAVHGHAIAGGAVLARCCDVAVGPTNPRARFGFTETAIGLEFPPKTLQAMRFRLPVRHHHELLLGAQLVGPQDALRLGVVNVLADDVLAEAQRRLRVLAQHPADAYAATKATLQAGATAVSQADQQRFLDTTVPLWTSEPIRARIRAVLQR